MWLLTSLSKTFTDYRCEGHWTIVIQARGFIVLRHGMMMDFFKGGGNYRGSKGLIEDRSKQTSKLISAGPQDTASNPIRSAAFLMFTPFSALEPRPPSRWSHDPALLCLLLSWCAARQSRAAAIASNRRRRCLILQPATDLHSPPRRICFQRHRWSLVPATCAESHWAENETQFSLCNGVWRHLLLVWEHNTLLYTRTYSQTKEPRCMRQCVC